MILSPGETNEMQVKASLGGRTAEQGVAAVVAAASEAQTKKNASGSCQEWERERLGVGRERLGVEK